MNTERICPNCRKPLPPDVPPGLCPECLAKSGIPPISPYPLPGGRPAAPEAMIIAPGVGLMVAGALKLLAALKLVLFLGWGVNWLNSFVPGLNFPSELGELIVFKAAFRMIAGLLILFGGYNMVRRQSYAWAIAAGIISIVACSIVGFPVGIWALIVLAQQNVRLAFNTNGASGALSRQPNRFWSGFAVLMAGVLLFLAAAGGVMFMAVRAIADSMGGPGLSAQTELSPQDMQKAGIYQEDGEFRKNFSQSFPLDANGKFSLDDINGHIEIQGWNSNVVILNAVIRGKTAESVAAAIITVDPDPTHAVVHTRLPSQAKDSSSFWDWLKNHTQNATVDYTVRLPLHARLENASTVNGAVAIGGMMDDITASTVNGAARVKNAVRNLKLATVNGSITADMDKVGEGQSVALNTVNGHIKLSLPDNTDATFSMATVNGKIRSDFPGLAVEKHFPISSSLNGSVGGGAASVSANTVNGGIQILKVASASAH